MISAALKTDGTVTVESERLKSSIRNVGKLSIGSLGSEHLIQIL